VILVSDIRAWDGKIANLFYSVLVLRASINNTYRRNTGNNPTMFLQKPLCFLPATVANNLPKKIPTLLFMHCIFKGLSQDGDGRNFLKNRRASSFNKDLSNEPNFDRINLAGHYL
jgi:hypothetical protein